MLAHARLTSFYDRQQSNPMARVILKSLLGATSVSLCARYLVLALCFGECTFVDVHINSG